jgi:hypothetical protein
MINKILNRLPNWYKKGGFVIDIIITIIVIYGIFKIWS